MFHGASLRRLRPWLSGRQKSFTFAFQGVPRLLAQPNARIHAAATVVVVIAGVVMSVPRVEWALLLLSMSAVWVAETLNTALELLADAAVPTRHPLVGAAKDVAAAAVLIAALFAVAVGILVFAPRVSGPWP